MSRLKSIALIIATTALAGCASLNQALVRYDSEPANKAIATDARGVWGMSWGQPSEEAAINMALQLCASHGGVLCKVDRVNQIRREQLPVAAGASNANGQRYTCDGITKGQAYRLLLGGHSYLDRDGDGHPCEWSSYSYFQPSNVAPRTSGRNCHYVSGYRRKNGTYVSGHMRCR